jgi:hypothetical protein
LNRSDYLGDFVTLPPWVMVVKSYLISRFAMSSAQG